MDTALAVFEAFASHAAGALLAGVAYALPIAIVAWAAIRLLPQANAATRYGIWLAALVATLALDPLPGHPWIAAAPASAAGHVTSVHRPALGQAPRKCGSSRKRHNRRHRTRRRTKRRDTACACTGPDLER